MSKILIIGAGRSATSLIEYMLGNAAEYNWQITVADMDLSLAQQKIAGNDNAKAIALNFENQEERRKLVGESDFIISMMPAFMHSQVAVDCVLLGKHLATASYVSPDIMGLHEAAKRKNIILLNECGLDPGIDHASAMKTIDEIKAKGGEVVSFKSYCGGLVAPESNDNPWGYKFSWNPRNVILAGQSTAQYIEDGEKKFIPYNRLFTQTEKVKVKGHGSFDAYANRDSISYIDLYELPKIKTMLRGTLRQADYCKAWNVFVKLGLTDDTYKIAGAGKISYNQFIASYLPEGKGSSKLRLQKFMAGQWDNKIEKMLDYLDLFSDKKIGLESGSPAQILQHILEKKWKLRKGDKDMVVMQHQFLYKMKGKKVTHGLNSSLVVIGKDQQHTAMALTVGLPLAITVKNILLKKINLTGVVIPTKKEIYIPMLKELEEREIKFNEEEFIL